jgi:hypothetical protein
MRVVDSLLALLFGLVWLEPDYDEFFFMHLTTACISSWVMPMLNVLKTGAVHAISVETQ